MGINITSHVKVNIAFNSQNADVRFADARVHSSVIGTLSCVLAGDDSTGRRPSG
jgi:hypothetical protein